jgi:nucleotide sugar dehydrogenase
MRGHWKARRLVVKVVIIGLGYVGLPLAQEAVRVGLRVTGLDVRQAAVDSLNAGRSHVDDLTDADVAAMVAGGFRAVATVPDVAAIVDEQGSDELGSGELGTGEHGPDVIVICVPTPLSESDGPDLTAVKAATDSAAKLLRAGTTVVLESTTYPGTTDEIVRPMLEKATGLTAGIDFSLAFSPERIDPGNGVYGIRNTPKVVGGITPACTDAAAAFYARVCDTVVRAKTAREAEMAKLLENTYRHVNIALVNEMAIFCHELGVDLWDAIRCASTKPFGFEAFYPGPGVGGHCIPIDPNYLSYKVRMELSYPFRFVELAQEINSRMPGYVVDRAAEILNSDAKPIKGARVLLLGVTYKKDIADQRESPARPIARKLLQRGAVLSYHDPYVESWTVDGRQVPRAQAPTDDADLTILLQAHSVYDLQEVAARAHLLFDTRGQRLPGDSVFPL